MCVIIYDEQSMTKLPLIREEDPSTFTSGIHSTSGETDDFLETGRRRRSPPPLLSSHLGIFSNLSKRQTGKKSNVARTRLP